MLDYPLGDNLLLPVRLLDNTGLPVTGKLAADVTITCKNGATTTSVGSSPVAWNEITTGAFANEGYYEMELADTVAVQAGMFTYAVSCVGARTFVGSVNVTDSAGGGGGPTAAQIADAVWDEALAGHAIAGSTGEALSDAAAGGSIDVGAIADAVWDEALAGHATSGTGGKVLADAATASALSAVASTVSTNLDATVSSRASATNLATLQLTATDVEADIAALQLDVDGIASDLATNLDVAVSSRATAADLGDLTAAVENMETAVGDVETAITAAQTDIAYLTKLQEGRWKIHLTGADANRLVIYDEDGTTPLVKFDLLDGAGDPTYINPFERTPVE